MDLSLNQGMSLPIYFLLTFFFFLFIATSKTRKRSSHGNKLPPGPPTLPLVGNIFQLGPNPHRSLADFSKTYGPIMSLKLGRLTTVVISSPEAAKEALRTHDNVMSARTFNDPIRAFDHHKHSIVWIPPSARWRFLKKTISKYLLSPQNLDAIQSLRMRKVEELVSLANQFSERGEAIDLARASFVTAFNIISNALFSVDLATYDSNSSPYEFYHAVVHLMKISGKPNVGDYFQYMRFLDLQGTRKEAVLCIDRLFSVIQEFIDDRLAKRLSHTDEEASSIDMLDSLLDFTQQNEAELTMNDIKHLLLDLFVAGTDTNSSTMEWAMTELVRSPDKMVKAQSEIRQVIGENGVVKESDIPSLPYLQAIVKETLRLHPPAALIPRKSESDVPILGFVIPENTQVLVNVWAIGHDSSVWENPVKFEPERFLLRETDLKGKDFELIPFGSGRRMCPGISMSLRTMYMVLASLLYSFDWKLPNGVVPENMDMSEAFGLTLHKAKPLCAVPIRKTMSI
ncbi:PREDICTED: cytochrome P450 76C3-like [Camelina sativa]|uniref:Cytochrome P450 76C3-like n=1 Tax=Camelina sativa TaxID=90675 RepID=A0ABM0YZ21_CAMSA|nr:PREDICTED: cytochrome P450 76C3-like [Camelina sativa]